jgi:hypothetical protein
MDSVFFFQILIFFSKLERILILMIERATLVGIDEIHFLNTFE